MQEKIPTDGDAAIRNWLAEVMRQTGLKLTPLAKQAGLAPSTLSRAMDPASGISLERRSIQKIIDTFGVTPPLLHAASTAAAPENDLRDLCPYSPASEAKVIDPTTVARWQVRSRALELAGCLVGDILIADSAISARPRDIVIAQAIAPTGDAETLARIYDPPYLLTATMDPSSREKPRLVDDTAVSIWGVVIRLERHLR